MSKVVLPELGEGIEAATVACWHVQQGQFVRKEDDIVELVTDKASFNVSATQTGKLKTICVAEGKDAKIGEVLAIIE